MVGELAHFEGVEIVGVETAADHLETVEVGGIELLEGADEGLHVEFGVSLVTADIGEADFDLIAKFGGLFFRLSDASLVALR